MIISGTVILLLVAAVFSLGMFVTIGYFAMRPKDPVKIIAAPPPIPISLIPDTESLSSMIPDILQDMEKAALFWGNDKFVVGVAEGGTVVSVEASWKIPAMRTKLRIRDRKVKSARILVNPDFFYKVSTRMVVRCLAHEMGHVLGLGHSDDPKSVMFAHPKEGGHWRIEKV